MPLEVVDTGQGDGDHFAELVQRSQPDRVVPVQLRLPHRDHLLVLIECPELAGKAIKKIKPKPNTKNQANRYSFSRILHTFLHQQNRIDIRIIFNPTQSNLTQLIS